MGVTMETDASKMSRWTEKQQQWRQRQHVARYSPRA